ncbi:MAG: ABC transporter ATP-binding protein [archaeon]
MALMSVKNIRKVFGDFVAVDEISFEIEKNQVFGLLGSNGAGKTTLINILTGLLLPTSGTARIMGYDLREDIEEIRKMIAVVPQTISLYENLSVYDNIGFFGSIYTRNIDDLPGKVEEIIRILGLDNFADKPIKYLSGGYQRRTSIGVALIAEPKVLFLDEPTVGIDMNTNQVIMNLIKSKSREMCVILTTHSLKEAESVCDYIYLMDKGRKVIEGKPYDVVSNYSKKIGEKISIQFTEYADMEEIKKILEDLAPLVYYVKILPNNWVSFNSSSIGDDIIFVLNKLKKVSSRILDINVKKPDLQDVFMELMGGR